MHKGSLTKKGFRMMQCGQKCWREVGLVSFSKMTEDSTNVVSKFSPYKQYEGEIFPYRVHAVKKFDLSLVLILV
jgi:hypothetical protein